MPEGNGISVLGRQTIAVIGATQPFHVWLSLTGQAGQPTRYRGLVILETFSLSSALRQELDTKELWSGGVRWRFTAQSNFAPTYQLRLVAQWKEAGLPFTWFWNN